MLGDRRRINRLLKPDRRRSPDRRKANRYTGRSDTSRDAGEPPPQEERRIRDRRFVDRIKSK